MTFIRNISPILIILLLLWHGCKKTEREMLLATGTPQQITTTTAVIPGTIVDMGENPLQHGHCYGTSPGVTISSSKTELGVPPKAGVFSSQLSDLAPNTTFYARAYITNSIKTVYGEEVSFKTDIDISVPGVTTNATPMGITTTTISVLCEVTSDGNSTVTERGIFYGTEAQPQTTGTKIEAGAGLGTYTVTIEGLTPGTTYYYLAYAINSAGTGYSEQRQTNTVAEPVFPSVTTATPIDINHSSTTVGGEVTSQGDSEVTERGVWYGTSIMPQNTGEKLSLGAGTGVFSGTLGGLQANTKYYVIAFATNSSGIGYGTELDFTTAQESSPPQVTTSTPSNITSNSATVGGEVTDEGNTQVLDRGIYWGTGNDPLITGTKLQIGSGQGAFQTNLTLLTPETTYYYVTYATNQHATSYGTVREFTTQAAIPVLPQVTTTAVSMLTNVSVVSGGTVLSDGGAGVSARGVVWSTSSGPTLVDSYSQNGSGIGVFISNISDLVPGTTYNIRAYATNSVGTAYGDERSFTTLNVPTIITADITDIMAYGAQGGGNVTASGGSTVISRGICWNTSGNPTVSDAKLNIGSGTGSFTGDITGLTPGTDYYVRAFAENSMGIAYGDQKSFLTRSLPLVTTTAPSNITNTSALSGGNVTSAGSAAVTSRGIVWSLSGEPTIETNAGITNNGDGNGIFISEMINLQPKTDYNVRAFATNQYGTGYGTLSSFRTLDYPTVTTTTASSIMATTAVSGGTVISDGGTSITERGLVWSKTVNPTLAVNDGKTTDGTGTGSYISNLTDLQPKTLYYIRAYATNVIGTSYGNEVEFTTAESAWAQIAEFGGAARQFAFSFAIGSKGYLGGGGASVGYVKDFWEYDPATNTWTQKADFGGGNRADAVGFAIGGKGYAGTGYFFASGTDYHYRDLWEYDPGTNIWIQRANIGTYQRDVAIGFATETRGYVGLGFNGDYQEYRSDFWEYNPSTNTWTQKANFGGAARMLAVGFAINGKGYAGLGKTSGGDTKDFWEFNPATNIWTQKADFGGTERRAAVGFAVGDKGYIGTGSGTKDFWEYDPSTNTWRQIEDFGGTARSSAAAFVIGDKGYVGTGGMTKDFWVFDPTKAK